MQTKKESKVQSYFSLILNKFCLVIPRSLKLLKKSGFESSEPPKETEKPFLTEQNKFSHAKKKFSTISRT